MGTHVVNPARATTSGTRSGKCCVCQCPACTGLECLERPRYFPGQLLTEAELNSEQAHKLAKDRLHNRYLHGYGTVCGLEVVCHDCEGWVTVRPGYAIDYCGNDVIVCKEEDFDLLRAIRECRDACRRPRRSECDPPRPPRDERCQDLEEEWCLTIRYEEKETRAITAVRPEKKKGSGCQCGGGCGCGSKGTGSPCGCAGTGSSSARLRNGSGTTPAACEPTRILEGYRFEVSRKPEQCAPSLRRNRDIPLFEWLSDVFGGTLVGNIAACFTELQTRFRERIPIRLQPMFTIVLAGLPLPETVSTADLYELCCRLQQLVGDLISGGTFNVRCASLRTLAEIVCPQPGADETPANYATRLRPIFVHYGAFLLQSMLDCFCHALLPPCPPDPCDERLILACITVRNDRIIRICNFSCRKFAGSFPNRQYWYSIGPFISALLVLFCCRPDLVRTNSPLVNDVARLLAAADPDGALQKAFAEGDFALPKQFAAAMGAVPAAVATAFAEAFRPRGVNLPTLVGMEPAQARQLLERSQVRVVERPVKSKREVPRTRILKSSPFASAGDAVVLYRDTERVLGYERRALKTDPFDKTAPDSAAPDEKLRSLEAEVATLRSELETLRTAYQGLKEPQPPRSPTPRKKQ